MDLQALTFVKLTEHQAIAFDPGKEDDYYGAVIDMTWLVRIKRRGLSCTSSLLHTIRTTGRRPLGRPGKLKATTG